MNNKNTYLIPFILITVLFFLWGFAHNLNPILIPHLKKACQLSDLQSALIDSAFFVAYFVMALPAGYFMNKYGYKSGIIFGLLLFALGAILFVPAANTLAFSFFLFALFVIASGLTFLETAANPYVTVLGDTNTATQRLNFSQSFNGLAASLAPFIGGQFILSGKNLGDTEISSMTNEQIQSYLMEEASSVKIPYIIISVVVLMVAFFIWRSNLPEIIEETNQENESGSGSILKQKNLVLGVIAQFFYVGAQVCISSFFIRFLGKTSGIDEKSAAIYLSVALLLFMIGRFVGTYLMRFVAPYKLLIVYSAINIVLLFGAIAVGGSFAIYALIGVEFFMSIMFPTIFSLSIIGLGKQTKLGSSLLIMSIVGGAIFPLIMGQISDMYSIQSAYVVPALCFFVVLYFGLKTTSKHSMKITSGH